MKYIKLLVSSLLLFGSGVSGLKAQVSTNASGGNAAGSGGTMSYSVGQILYTTHTGTNGSSAESVQQPFEISVVTSIEEAKSIHLTILAHPNPTTDFLTLSIGDLDPMKLSYQLYDINGKLLETKTLKDKQTSIAMRNLVPATYFVKVAGSNQELTTFKIIKN